MSINESAKVRIIFQLANSQKFLKDRAHSTIKCKFNVTLFQEVYLCSELFCKFIKRDWRERMFCCIKLRQF